MRVVRPGGRSWVGAMGERGERNCGWLDTPPGKPGNTARRPSQSATKPPAAKAARIRG